MKPNPGGRQSLAARSMLAALALAAVVSSAQFASAPPPGWENLALAFAESEHMFGRISQASSSYSGSFVSFQFNEPSVTMSQYIVRPSTLSSLVFSSIFPDIVVAGTASVNGSIFTFSSTAIEMLVCNNPTAAMIFRSAGVTLNVTFILAGDVDADRNGQSLNLSTPVLEARLLVTGTATLDLIGSSAVARLPPGTSAIFRANAMAGESVAGAIGQEAIANATVRHLLALESFEVGFEGFIGVSDNPYGTVRELNSTLTSSGVQHDLEVNSASPQLAAFHIHNSILSTVNAAQIKVRLDHADIAILPSFDDLVDYHGSAPACVHHIGPKGLLVLVYLPQQGSHTLTIENIIPPADQGLNPIQVLAIVAVILVILGVAATVMLRRKPRM